MNGSGVQGNNLENTNTNIQNTNNGVGAVSNVNTNSVNASVSNATTGVNNSTMQSNQNLNNTQPINTGAVTQQVQNPQPTSGSNTDSNNANVDANYKPPGKFKVFMLLLFLIGLIVFVIFLPEIQAYIEEYQANKNEKVSDDIVSGTLVCTLSQDSSNLSKEFVRKFVYTDKKLESSTFTTTIKGDPSEDEKTLDDLAEKCKLIKSNVSSLSGISVSCEYDTGKLVEIEKFDYKSYNPEEVKSVYTEAGGDITEYSYGYDIDKIMTSMRQGGFNCNKEK